jgi:polar amino acid transport system substrate-binding protein
MMLAQLLLQNFIAKLIRILERVHFMSKWLQFIVLIQFSDIGHATNSQIIDVIAVEYPPFTSSSIKHGGILFELLHKVTTNEKLQWSPFIVPPSRAEQLISSNNWCASFYPITRENISFEQYKLSDELVKLGLFRGKLESEFQWSNLDELQGKSISLLRTSEKSAFAQQFISAGLKVVFVENVDIALKMLLKQRVDYAFGDKDAVSRSTLSTREKEKLQFSKNILLEMQVSIFINPDCNISLREDLLINKQ